ncbi:MAG: membrane lipoprotein lipid attachment site-containing protein [Candidatus Margulisbacteria bacterium]|nr:membrane lipoprotein lipid attachment site-containing protein [Candidatus Margulisiibacteriota bacterium]
MKKILFILFLPIMLILTGCQTNMVVNNVDVKTLSPLLTDYALLNGYKILYRNENTGAYRIYLGQMYIPAQLETYKEKTTQLNTKDIQHDLTKYEETTFKAISQKDQYVDLVVMVRLFNQNNDVKMTIESDGEYYYQPTATQGNKLKRYLENSGYAVTIQ